MQPHLQLPFPSLIKIPVCLLCRLVCIMIPQVVFILKQVLHCFLSWAAFGFTNNFSFYLLSFLCSYLVFSLNVPSQISSRHLFPHNSNALHNFSVNFFFFWLLPPILICSDCSSRDFNLLLSLFPGSHLFLFLTLLPHFAGAHPAVASWCLVRLSLSGDLWWFISSSLWAPIAGSVLNDVKSGASFYQLFSQNMLKCLMCWCLCSHFLWPFEQFILLLSF